MISILRKYFVRKYYQRWVADIVTSDTTADLDEHIIKHALELREPNRNPESWSASMHNLIDIYDPKHNIYKNTELQIRKLEGHYRKNQMARTPPPNGRVPFYVKNTVPPKHNT